jgi:hypothetical protein
MMSDLIRGMPSEETSFRVETDLYLSEAFTAIQIKTPHYRCTFSVFKFQDDKATLSSPLKFLEN